MFFLGAIFVSFLMISSSASSMSLAQLRPEEIENEGEGIISEDHQQKLNMKSVIKNIFFGRKDSRNLQLNFFTSTITTTCDDIEKTSEITFALSNEIDVDNDENTGINGKDIRVQYLILPYFLPSPEFTLGAVFSVSVERIGDEIKNSAFSLSASIADNLISVGYESPKQSSNEIPKRIQLSTTAFIEPIDGITGMSFFMSPSYDENQEGKQITLFGGFDDTNVKRSYAFGFQPASDTQITLRSTKNPDKWEYILTRDTPYETILTVEMTKITEDTSKTTKLTIDSLPEEISFSLALTPFSSEGGSIEYESSSMYDVEVLIETEDLGQCKYALIKNTPKSLSAEWIPSRENGFYHINIDSEDTSIYVLNSLDNPTINFSIKQLTTVDMTTFWNLTNPGNFEIQKDPSLHLDLDILFEDWEAQLDARPTAEYIYCAWKSNVTGFLRLDTNQDPLSTVNLLIKGPENGLSVIGETLAAEDFQLDWTVWPLSEFNINRSGELDFFSLAIEVFVNDQWHHLWPWF